MSSPVVGLIMPSGNGEVPEEAALLYPKARFLTAVSGVQGLSAEGYAPALERIVELAVALARRGAEAIGISGTSLTFYHGEDFHAVLQARCVSATGLPVTTMSAGVVQALKQVSARRVAVGTAYAEGVNVRLFRFLETHGFDVQSIQGLGLVSMDSPAKVTSQQLEALAERAVLTGADPSRPAQALLLACGGLRVLDVTLKLEERWSIPVVSSRAAFLKALMDLLIHPSGCATGGRLFSATRSG